MKKEADINEVCKFLKKVQESPESVTRSEKKKMKKYLNDPEIFLRAIGMIADNILYITPEVYEGQICEDTEGTIAQNYIDLAYFVLDRMREKGVKGLNEIRGLSAEIDEDSLTVFALTPKPIELDFPKYVSSDYPIFKEKLMEIEALQSDIITFGDKTASFAKIKALIEADIPD